jgi:hypothetical protein
MHEPIKYGATQTCPKCLMDNRSGLILPEQCQWCNGTGQVNGLRLAHWRQLSSYVHDRDREGWYYGKKDQFEKRHADLVKWIDNAVKYAESEGVKMPKRKPLIACNCISGRPQTTDGCPFHGVKF